jgi:hypothetical protein
MPAIDCIEESAGFRQHEIVGGIIHMAKEKRYCKEFCTVPELSSWARDRGLFLTGMNGTYSQALLGQLVTGEEIFKQSMTAQNYDPVAVMSRLNEVAQAGHMCAAENCTFAELQAWATVTQTDSPELIAAANALRCPGEKRTSTAQSATTSTCTAAVRLQALGPFAPVELLQFLLTQALSYYASSTQTSIARSTVDVSIHPLTPSQCHHPAITSACFEINMTSSALGAMNVLKHFADGTLNLTGIIDESLDAEVDSEFCKYADDLSELEELLPKYEQELEQALGVQPEMLSIGPPEEVESAPLEQQYIDVGRNDVSSFLGEKTFKLPVKLDLSISSNVQTTASNSSSQETGQTTASNTRSAEECRHFDAMYAAGQCRALEDRDGGYSSSAGQAFFLGVVLPVGFSLLSMCSLTFLYAHLSGYDGKEPDASEPLPSVEKDETRLLQSTDL